MFKHKLVYLASPYTHLEEQVRNDRYDIVNKLTVDLLKQGLFVFSPIAYNHPMVKHDLPTSWSFWQDYDRSFLERCDELWVAKIEGWEQSVGVAAEINIANELGIPVLYIDPYDAPSN